MLGIFGEVTRGNVAGQWCTYLSTSEFKNHIYAIMVDVLIEKNSLRTFKKIEQTFQQGCAKKY